jgi:hypothetical protein
MLLPDGPPTVAPVFLPLPEQPLEPGDRGVDAVLSHAWNAELQQTSRAMKAWIGKRI